MQYHLIQVKNTPNSFILVRTPDYASSTRCSTITNTLAYDFSGPSHFNQNSNTGKPIEQALGKNFTLLYSFTSQQELLDTYPELFL